MLHTYVSLQHKTLANHEQRAPALSWSDSHTSLQTHSSNPPSAALFADMPRSNVPHGSAMLRPDGTPISRNAQDLRNRRGTLQSGGRNGEAPPQMRKRCQPTAFRAVVADTRSSACFTPHGAIHPINSHAARVPPQNPASKQSGNERTAPFFRTWSAARLLRTSRDPMLRRDKGLGPVRLSTDTLSRLPEACKDLISGFRHAGCRISDATPGRRRSGRPAPQSTTQQSVRGPKQATERITEFRMRHAGDIEGQASSHRRRKRGDLGFVKRTVCLTCLLRIQP